ncbi:hypothetical protein K435DRAFT_572827, partial [Dendrothele bispora CBS 962.96]
VYEVASSEPRWMVEVTIQDGKYFSHKQINWKADGRRYTAISYPVDSAFVLFSEAGKRLQDPKPEGKKYALEDRKRIAEQLLIEYCSARRDQQVPPDWTEFVWIDELCLPEEKEERATELSRLTDIFRAAHTVAVFCHDVGCNHTSFTCQWGRRLYTLGEILHANKVQRMTREILPGKGAEIGTFLYSESARSFRERMMNHAAKAGKWHLHSLLRQ